MIHHIQREVKVLGDAIQIYFGDSVVERVLMALAPLKGLRLIEIDTGKSGEL